MLDSQVPEGHVRVIAFEDFVIDAERFELRRGGKTIGVEPKVLDLIVYLARNPTRVVSRDELLDALWKDTHVSDAALSRAVREARRVLRDDGATQRTIRTVHGRGYRFVASLDDAALAPRQAQPAEAPFFGRDEILGQCAELLDRVSRGRGATLLVQGEPGIGKTALLARCLELAAERDMLVVSGRSTSIPGAPAFWPWVQVIRGCLTTMPDRSAASPAAMEVLGPLLASPSTSTYNSHESRFAVLDAMGRLLAQLAEERPVMVGIDDLHGADSGSRAMAEWLAAELGSQRLLFMLTARTSGGRGLPREVVVRADVNVQLDGLANGDVRNWLGSALGEEPGDPVVRRVLAATKGNPLYIRHLLSAPDAALALRTSPLPAQLREAIVAHLEGLDEHDRALLEAASAAGDTFSPALVAAALACDLDELLTGTERLEHAGWLQRSPDLIGHLELSHGMVRAVLYEALDKTRRAALHERMALALLDNHDGLLRQRTEQIAYHLMRAPASLRIDPGLGYATGAAHEAFRKGAFDRCVQHCRAALETMALAGVEPAMRRDLLLLLGSALGRDGDLEAAARRFQEASRVSEWPPRRRTAMAADARQLVRQSFAQLAPRLTSLVHATYSRFFAAHPELRALFHRNTPRVQELMLADTLTSVVDRLEDTPWLESMLVQLGCGHAYYGVTEEMFEWFGEALIASLADELGGHFNAATAAAWEEAYATISAMMIEGMLENLPR